MNREQAGKREPAPWSLFPALCFMFPVPCMPVPACLAACMSVRHSVCLPVSLSVSLSPSVYVCIAACPYVSLSACLSLCPSLVMRLCQSVCLSINLYDCISVYRSLACIRTCVLACLSYIPIARLIRRMRGPHLSAHLAGNLDLSQHHQPFACSMESLAGSHNGVH